MDPQQVTTMAHKFQAVLDADVLNERANNSDLPNASASSRRWARSIILAHIEHERIGGIERTIEVTIQPQSSMMLQKWESNEREHRDDE
jgi:hypothetical protein